MALLFAASALDERALRDLLKGPPRVVNLPAATILVSSEIRVPRGFELRGKGESSTLREAPGFEGRAVLVCESGVTVADLRIEGEPLRRAAPRGLPPYDRSFLSYYDRNGIVVNQVHNLHLRNITVANIANFAVIVSASSGVTLDGISVLSSGSTNAKGRNNTSGGILLEEGTRDFAVKGCSLQDVKGNGIWTHSLYTSPRNGPGVFTGNHFRNIGRDALQAGHATRILIEQNTGDHIGWPESVVDIEGGGTPVAIDTAGNVDATTYAGNRFEDVNGKCIDLDGFHHGTVRDNVCVNVSHYGIVFNNTNPDMQSEGITVAGNTIDGARYGGVFVIGQGHTISNNRFLRLNLAGCRDQCTYDPKQPDLLRAGIYLAAGAERPALTKSNVITGNTVTGLGMAEHCIATAPGVDAKAQTIMRNHCSR